MGRAQVLSTVHRPVYPDKPGSDVISAFLEHVKATGAPESFPSISTSKPPETGQVEVLHSPVDIPRGRRSDGKRAPCSLCSPTKPKFETGGMLLWCADAAAIYCIGPTCSTESAWRRKVDEAFNRYREAEQAKQDAAALIAHVTAAPERLSWIAAQRAKIAATDQVQGALSKLMPKLRRALRMQVKASTNIPGVGNVQGASFLGPPWQLVAKLDGAEKMLWEAVVDAGGDSRAWATALVPSQRKLRAGQLRRVLESLESVVARMADARAFLSERNVDVLSAWSKSPDAPLYFTLGRTAGGVELRCGEDRWRASFLATDLPAIPGPV